MADSLPQHTKQQVVLCDMCTENRRPARKTCMKCEISMCVQHLQAHLTTPVLLQTHPLTEPLAPGEAGLGATKCPQHGKMLEYYCLDDLTCVCVSCSIEDQHRLHNMKTISTAHKELMEKLGVEQEALAKTVGKGRSLEYWEKVERGKLVESSVRLIEAVSKMRDLALASVQSSVSARMVSIKTTESSFKAAQSEKDTFRFLQMFSGVHQDVQKAKAVDLRNGLEPGSDRDKLVQELRHGGDEMVKKAVQLCGSLLTLVDPENHLENIPGSYSVLTFDPMSLRKGMSISSDHRKVFYSRETSAKRPAHTLRIKRDRPDANWMISLPEDCDWTVGVCDEVYAETLKHGHVHGLSCQGKQLCSLTTHYVSNQHHKVASVSSQVIKVADEKGDKETSLPQKVEVLWNGASHSFCGKTTTSSISFFNRSGPHQRTEILTLTTTPYQGTGSKLTPFVYLGEEKASKEVVRMLHQSQQQLKCLCGKSGNSYSGYNRGYNYTSSASTWNTCNFCGAVEEAPVQEVLCELIRDGHSSLRLGLKSHSRRHK